MVLGAPLALRPLGSTGLEVPALCVGCAPLGDMPEAFGYGIGEAPALELCRAILDGPIRFADTAAAYGEGRSERRLGIALRERGGLPPGFVLATKADRDLRTGRFDGDQVRRSVEGSLRRLGLDRIQICFLHDPEHIPSFETAMARGGPVEALCRCQEEGLIAHLGVAGGPIPLLVRYVETGRFTVAISHNRHTLLNGAAAPLWAVCQRRAVAAINAAPYGGGILARGPKAHPRYAYRPAGAAVLERARHLESICRSLGVPLAAVALQFSLRDPRLASTIVGVSSVSELEGMLALAAWPVPAALWEDLARLPVEMADPEAAPAD